MLKIDARGRKSPKIAQIAENAKNRCGRGRSQVGTLG
jgi:hypothetical protein